MRLLSAAAVCLTVAILWLAGETHRAGCQRAGQTGCSVLPWSGHRSRVAAPSPATSGQGAAASFVQRALAP